MSVRTILEINHDYLEELRKMPFDTVVDYLMHGAYTDKFRLPSGIRVLAQKHHADELVLKIK